MVMGLQCDPAIVTGDSTSLFADFGISCTVSDATASWTVSYEPAFVANATAVDAGSCIGW